MNEKLRQRKKIELIFLLEFKCVAVKKPLRELKELFLHLTNKIFLQ